MTRRAKGWLSGIVTVVAVVLGFHFLFPLQEMRFARGLERKAAHLEEKSIEVNGLHVAYLEGGKGPPLVLVHGFGADKDNWVRVSKHLTDSYHVVAPDLPGFGDSSKPVDARYRIDDSVERLHAIVGAMGLTHFDLGGNSMGGCISATYAAKYPNDVASLWLLDPGCVATAEPSDMAKAIIAGAPVPLLARDEAEFDALIGWVFHTPPFIPHAYKKVLAARGAANYELHSRIFREIRGEYVPLEQLVKGLPIPTRIVWGADDRVLHPSGAKVLASLLPQSSVTLMPGVGHLPMLEQPKATAEDYRAFRATLR
ncbi:MAG TPA: alpha/beta fold hydrolase [Candidatus Binatia bacterium]|nr:alpha/beta fold hydrolase [Candidatus Binatia bacterium]